MFIFIIILLNFDYGKGHDYLLDVKNNGMLFHVSKLYVFNQLPKWTCVTLECNRNFALIFSFFFPQCISIDVIFFF